MGDQCKCKALSSRLGERREERGERKERSTEYGVMLKGPATNNEINCLVLCCVWLMEQMDHMAPRSGANYIYLFPFLLDANSKVHPPHLRAYTMAMAMAMTMTMTMRMRRLPLLTVRYDIRGLFSESPFFLQEFTPFVRPSFPIDSSPSHFMKCLRGTC